MESWSDIGKVLVFISLFVLLLFGREQFSKIRRSNFFHFSFIAFVVVFLSLTFYQGAITIINDISAIFVSLVVLFVVNAVITLFFFFSARMEKLGAWWEKVSREKKVWIPIAVLSYIVQVVCGASFNSRLAQTWEGLFSLSLLFLIYFSCYLVAIGIKRKRSEEVIPQL